MNATEAIGRVIDDLNLPKPKYLLYGAATEQQFLKIFGMMELCDLKHVLRLGGNVVTAREEKNNGTR